MTSPAPSRRRHGVLLIWCGSVAMVLTGAFTLAWVKLPDWKPEWVIAHSPWMDPTVRALIAYDLRGYDDVARERIMEWGPAIGPLLRRHYEAGSPEVREQVLILAATTLEQYDGDDSIPLFRNQVREPTPGELFRPRQDGRRLSLSEEEALRADLTWLAATASAEASDNLRYHSLALITGVRDPDLMQVPCDWLLSGTSDFNHALIKAINDLRDPRSVPRLMPLLSTIEKTYERELVASALRRCLAPSQVAEVVEASRHPDRHIRAWAASVIDLVHPTPVLEEGVARLLADPEADVRLMALAKVIHQGLPLVFHDQVIDLLADPTHEIRKMAVEAIIDQGVPVTLRATFLERVTDPAADLRLMVIDAIGALGIHEGGDLLLASLTVEAELFLRISMIEALGRLEQAEIKPVLRQIAQRPTDQMRGAAIVALGMHRDPTDFPLLLSLLANEDDDISRKARIALGYLPLTPEQQKHVDVLWAEEQSP